MRHETHRPPRRLIDGYRCAQPILRGCEFYERRDAALAQALDLEPMRRNARGARYGFPVAALRVYLARLLALGRPVMVIGEEDEYLTTVKTRAPVCRYDALTSGEQHLVQERSGQG